MSNMEIRKYTKHKFPVLTACARERYDTIRRMLSEGMTMHDIAESLGITRQALWEAWHRIERRMDANGERIVIWKPCSVCGKTYATSDPSSHVCSIGCYRRKYYSKKPKAKVERVCKMCGNKFTTARDTKLYCSADCKNRARYINHIEERKRYSREAWQRKKSAALPS